MDSGGGRGRKRVYALLLVGREERLSGSGEVHIAVVAFPFKRVRLHEGAHVKRAIPRRKSRLILTRRRRRARHSGRGGGRREDDRGGGEEG